MPNMCHTEGYRARELLSLLCQIRTSSIQTFRAQFNPKSKSDSLIHSLERSCRMNICSWRRCLCIGTHQSKQKSSSARMRSRVRQWTSWVSDAMYKRAEGPPIDKKYHRSRPSWPRSSGFQSDSRSSWRRSCWTLEKIYKRWVNALSRPGRRPRRASEPRDLLKKPWDVRDQPL